MVHLTTSKGERKICKTNLKTKTNIKRRKKYTKHAMLIATKYKMTFLEIKKSVTWKKITICRIIDA